MTRGASSQSPPGEKDIPELLDDDSKSLVSGGTIVVETTESHGVEMS
jgi:hypothetical protein